MGRLIALDYGTKRTGIAETDDLQIIASGLTTVNTPELFKFLVTYFAKHQVDAIILGEPKRLNGEPTHNTIPVQEIKKKLEETFGHISIKMVDERFTSKMAFQTMIDSGLSKKKRQNKALVDEISACIILQSYMSSF
ncbi:Holliday junction resolvase RuvX [Putridiphycobacter roseus]|uniref:Putative pre-16S rRNA nuclease n=1 Tax=Putridiphycobacter roseus TaxID=2219161 RepID=A0A2W1NNF8_9FLAO|nr:Holliday junction resolvase RuvX [Putridiphycobacter roseus]PZE16128.1 Holliday junction resolvase RuvX [Putridiphycobacter roseus]